MTGRTGRTEKYTLGTRYWYAVPGTPLTPQAKTAMKSTSRLLCTVLMVITCSHSPQRSCTPRGLACFVIRPPAARSIAFAYAGDIWVASREGGDARRLTSFPGEECYPQLS